MIGWWGNDAHLPLQLIESNLRIIVAKLGEFKITFWFHLGGLCGWQGSPEMARTIRERLDSLSLGL